MIRKYAKRKGRREDNEQTENIKGLWQQFWNKARVFPIQI
jgi:hypothetical protein